MNDEQKEEFLFWLLMTGLALLLMNALFQLGDII